MCWKLIRAGPVISSDNKAGLRAPPSRSTRASHRNLTKLADFAARRRFSEATRPVSGRRPAGRAERSARIGLEPIGSRKGRQSAGQIFSRLQRDGRAAAVSSFGLYGTGWNETEQWCG